MIQSPSASTPQREPRSRTRSTAAPVLMKVHGSSPRMMMVPGLPRALFAAHHRHLHGDAYAFMIEKFKCKRRDYGTVRNVEHDQARKHNAASGTVALRDTLQVARASKAASEA